MLCSSSSSERAPAGDFEELEREAREAAASSELARGQRAGARSRVRVESISADRASGPIKARGVTAEFAVATHRSGTRQGRSGARLAGAKVNPGGRVRLRVESQRSGADPALLAGTDSAALGPASTAQGVRLWAGTTSPRPCYILCHVCASAILSACVPVFLRPPPGEPTMLPHLSKRAVELGCAITTIEILLPRCATATPDFFAWLPP